MNIYKNIRENIFKTWLLIFLIFVFIVLVGFVLSFVFNSRAILYLAIIFGLLMNFISYFWSDKLVIAMVGAQKIEKKDFPELWNIVENLSLTAGIPMPKIYIWKTNALNAFATGRNYKNSAIVVTSAILDVLNKQELEGVIAHEISHIKNRDILVGTVAAILVSIISLIGDFTLRSFWFSSDRDRNINPIVFILAVIGLILSPIFAQLIQLAISRQREFLADSSGVLLTRYPEGLANALLKISQNPTVSAPQSFSHLFIANPFKADQRTKKTPWYIKIWLTHPPIEERIKRILGRV